jgi:DNA modification methylase
VSDLAKDGLYDFPVDQIYRGDGRNMKEVRDGRVSLIVCSPPYNVRKPYSNHDDDMPLDEYKKLLLDVWRECKRVLRPGGRLCVNVAGVWRQPYLPLHSIIWEQLVDQLKFQMRGEIIWNKGASVGVSTAWGSFASPSNPTLRDVHEYVLVFSKDGEFKLENQTNETPDIRNIEFVEWTRSVWDMPTESAKRVGHPAPFPEELPRRLILLYTFPGDIVLDPFAGSGSTCLAAYHTKRRYVGYDVDGGYVRVARKRLREAKEAESAVPLEGMPSARRARASRPTPVDKISAASLIRSGEVRPREVKVSTQDGTILLNIATKVPGERDIAKQNPSARLSPAEARRLASALQQAARSVTPEEETQ